MMRIMMQILKCAVVIVLLQSFLLQSGLAAEESYPSRPLRMIIPFPPGGGTDTLARPVAKELEKAWGKPVVVENRGGANGTIGAAVVAKSAPDGHTMLIVPYGFAVNPSMYKELPFDAARDFEPVSQLASNPSVLVVHPSFPPRTVKELIALLKKRPGEINYASSGSGSPPHLFTEQFMIMTGTRMTHIPYKGGGPATIAIISGEVSVYIMAPLQAMPHLKSGRLIALGVTSKNRDPAFPDIPTIAEAGVPGYAMTNWYGLLVPGGTPKPVVSKLNAEIVRILNLRDIKDRLAAEGVTVVGSTPEEFAAFLKDEIAKSERIVKKAGIDRQ